MNWRALIKSLPPGLTFKEAAVRLGRPYNNTRLALHKYRYKAADGRAFSQRGQRKVRLEDIDWRQSNVEIARTFGASRELVRQLRKKLRKPFVEARGRKSNKIPLASKTRK